jgi:hypothetical protein
MHDVNVPTHKAHLQAQYCRVAAFVGQYELDGIAIRNPHKALPKDVRTTFVDGLIPGEPLTKVGVEPNLISVGATGVKTDRV